MAIKFEDNKNEKPVKSNAAPAKPSPPSSESDAARAKRRDDDAPVLPFAKPVRPEKKKRGS